MLKIIKKVKEMIEIVAYVDGSCDVHKENKPGGYGCVLKAQGTDKLVYFSGWTNDTTINQMEVYAIIKILKVLPDDINIKIVTDSKYAQGVISKGWIARKNYRLVNKARKLYHDKPHCIIEWNKRCSDGYQEVADSLAKESYVEKKSKKYFTIEQ